MFNISMMVEDNKLTRALKALDGLVHHLQVLPVHNAEVKKGTMREKYPNQGATATLRSLVKAAADAGKLVVTRADLSTQMGQTGYHPQNASIGIKQLMEKGALIKTARGVYSINAAML